MSKFCKNCGAQLTPGAGFCASCGAGVSAPTVPAQAVPASSAAKKRGLPTARSPIPVISAVLVLALGIGILPGLLGGCGKNPAQTGAAAEQNISADKKATVGDLSKTGWQLDLPEDAIEGDSKLTMKVLSEAEAQNYQSGGFTFYGTPVEIKLAGRENVRLGEPVSVTMRIPKERMKDAAAEELFFAYYHDGAWEYFMPDNVDMDRGIATVNVYHFSFFGFGRPSEENQIKTFAQNFAALQWESQKNTKKLTDSLSRQYDDLFASMGVNDSSLRTQLTLDVIGYLESEKLDTGDMSPISTLANMANAVSQGQAGMDDFRGQLIEFTGKALYRTLEKDPGKFSSLANVTGGLSTAAGAISAGDTEGALQGIASMLRGANPIVAVADTALTCVKETMEYGIELWTQSEIEKAYQVYIGNAAGKYGYEDGLEGDFDTIFTTLGGGERMMSINIVKKYCQKYGMKESELTQEDRNRIVNNAMTALKRNFDSRKASEPEIEKLRREQEAFIAALKNEGLLSASSYRDYFGIDKSLRNFSVGDRLARLYRLKATVLSTMDKAEAAKISDEFLAKAIDRWVYWNEQGNREGYFKYMREMGYIKEPYTFDPAYAWVLVETLDFENAEAFELADAHDAYAVSHGYAPGSYSASNTYEGPDYYKEGLKGTLAVQATFTGIPEVIYPDKPVSINLSFTATKNDVVKLLFGAAAGADFDGWDLKPGSATGGRILFVNAEGEHHFTIQAQTGPQSYNETLTATLGSGHEGGRIALRTHLYQGASMGTNYVYEWKPVN